MTEVSVKKRDGDLLVAWVREAADEIEKAHLFLDANRVPREMPGTDTALTLAARIAIALDVDAVFERVKS